MGSGPVQMKLKKKIERPPQKDALNWTGPSVQFKLDRTTGSPDWSGPVQMKLKKKLRDPPRKTPSTGPVRPSSSNWTGPLDHRTGPVQSSSNLTGPLDTGLVQSSPVKLFKNMVEP